MKRLEVVFGEAVESVLARWSGNRYLDGLEPGVAGTRALLDLARLYRERRAEVGRLRLLAGRAVAGLFFDPSLRTRTSMEVASGRLGAQFIHLQVGRDTWAMEFRDGVVMDGASQEHIREAAPVLSCYADLLAVRAFPKEPGEGERVIRGFSAHATVPVLNLESAFAHPCQGLADQLTLADLGGGDFAGRKVCLTWAPHPRPLPQAVPLSVVRAAVLGGADLHLAAPEGFDLDAGQMARAHALCPETGARITLCRDPDEAADGALAVYAKGWAVQQEGHAERVAGLGSWTVTAERMRNASYFLHCLPIRRNVIATDAVLDSPKSRVVAQAANREAVQAALLLAWLL